MSDIDASGNESSRQGFANNLARSAYTFARQGGFVRNAPGVKTLLKKKHPTDILDEDGDRISRGMGHPGEDWHFQEPMSKEDAMRSLGMDPDNPEDMAIVERGFQQIPGELHWDNDRSSPVNWATWSHETVITSINPLTGNTFKEDLFSGQGSISEENAQAYQDAWVKMTQDVALANTAYHHGGMAALWGNQAVFREMMPPQGRGPGDLIELPRRTRDKAGRAMQRRQQMVYRGTQNRIRELQRAPYRDPFTRRIDPNAMSDGYLQVIQGHIDRNREAANVQRLAPGLRPQARTSRGERRTAAYNAYVAQMRAERREPLSKSKWKSGPGRNV